MNPRFLLPVIALTLAVALPASADETLTEVVKFEPGGSSAVVTGRITGRESVVYKVNARDGQFLKVSLRHDNRSAGYNIYIPGRGPGDEALYNSEAGRGFEYLGQLYKTGDHLISVFLNRAAARQGQTANYDLTISVTDGPPGEVAAPVAEEVPATGPVPQKVIDDCLVALRKELGQEAGLKVISAERGETAFEVLVDVSTASAPWKCFHDGTRVTQTMFTGSEGNL